MNADFSHIMDQMASLKKPNFKGQPSVRTMPVQETSDLKRIQALPQRRPPTAEEKVIYAKYMTEMLRWDRKSTCECKELRPNVPNPCIKDLLPVQGWYLYEAMTGGVLGHLAVGAGKTGVGLLLPMVVPNVKRAVLLIPPNLRDQLKLDYRIWSQHFRVPNIAGNTGPYHADRPVLHVLAYSELSHASSSVWLTTNAPDLIIADEVQALRDKKSVRSGRFLRALAAKPDTKFCCHSGSLTARSLEDYDHLSAISLREGSPLPVDPMVTRAWCAVLDAVPAGGYHAPMGALAKLCKEGETAREGFQRRLLNTKGVVTTEDAMLPVKLSIRERKVEGGIPDSVREALQFTRTRQQRPDGEELVEATEVAAVTKQLSYGLYMRWTYPHMEPEPLINEWFKKRQAFNRELREKLQYRRDHLDSPLLCKQAAQRYIDGYSGVLPTWRTDHYLPWVEIKDQVEPVPAVVWVDDFLAKDAAKWAKENVGIVWVAHPSFGAKVAALSGLQYFGAGDEASRELLKVDGKKSIICSIKAHGTGKNLQMFSRNLIANPPSNGADYEQLVGRTHRYGQRSDVTVELYQHTQELVEAFEAALKHATYVRQTTGTLQKLLFAERAL